METKNKIKKSKNVVKMMREIREEMSAEIMDMTYEEERAYLDKLLSTSKMNKNSPTTNKS